MTHDKKNRAARGRETRSEMFVLDGWNSSENKRSLRKTQAHDRVLVARLHQLGVPALPDRIGFVALNRAALPLAYPICRRLLPSGIVKGHEFLALAPHRADRRLGSFSVNLRTGKWADFATGDRGGDLCSLMAFVEAVSQPEAARLLARLIGFDLGRRGRE